MASPKIYAGVVCEPTRACVKVGGQFRAEGEGGREALRELLPYVAHGWAPEWIDSHGLYCGVRALARSIGNMVTFHTGSKIPEECSFPRLLKTLLSYDYRKGWRSSKEDIVLSWNRNDPPAFCNAGNFFWIDDLRYLLEYINEKDFLPIKFRLGIISQYKTVDNPSRGKEQITSLHICQPLVHQNEALPVVWLHNIEDWHWQSIGPRPGHDGLALFQYWGLEQAAKEVVQQGLFYVPSKSSEKNANELASDLPMLNLREYSFVYKHPTRQVNIYPIGWKERDNCFFGLTPRSRAHDIYGEQYRPQIEGKGLEGYVSVDSVQQVEEFPTTAVIPGRTEYGRKRRQLIMKSLKGERMKIYDAQNYGTDMLGGINDPYVPSDSRKSGSSTFGSKSTASPKRRSLTATSPPKGGKKDEALAKTSPKKRSQPKSSDPVTGTEESQTKKPRTGHSQYSVTPGQGTQLETAFGDWNGRPIFAPPSLALTTHTRSASNIRMFRAIKNSRLFVSGIWNALDYRANELVIAIEPIPERPTEAFWARRQDMAEGMVDPANLAEFTKKREGLPYLPFGLEYDDLLPPVPFQHQTYLGLGDKYINGLRKRCGVALGSQYMDDIIKRIIECRRQEGIPVAFWKGLDAVMFEETSPPVVDRYVRMANYNSKSFHADTLNDTCFVWLKDTSLRKRERRRDQVRYAHDMNWGLRLAGRKHQDDLSADCSKIGRKRIPPPLVHKPLTIREKGEHMVWGKGMENKMTPQQRLSVQLFRKHCEGFDNENRTPREVEAVHTQHPRSVPTNGGQMVTCLEFMKGDRIWMDAPLGLIPNHGWQGWLLDDQRMMKKKKGFIYPAKVRDLREDERNESQKRDAIRQHEDYWEKKMVTEAAEKAAKKVAKCGTSTIDGPFITTKKTTTIAAPTDSTTVPTSREWMGGGMKKRPNLIAQLDAVLDAENQKHKRISQELTDAGIEDYIQAEKKRYQDILASVNKFKCWFKTKEGIEQSQTQPELNALARKALVDAQTQQAIHDWLGSSEAFCQAETDTVDDAKIPDSPTHLLSLPTTNPAKPLINRSPGAWRKPGTGKLMTEKDFKRMQTVFYPVPKIRPRKSSRKSSWKMKPSGKEHKGSAEKKS